MQRRLGGDDSRVGGSGRRIGSRCLALFLLDLRVDGDLDSDRATADILVVEGSDSLVLTCLVDDVDEAVTLAAAGVPPAAADDVGRLDLDAGVLEEGLEASVVEGEAEVGDKDHVLGRFAGRVLARSTAGGTRSPRLLDTGCLGLAALSGRGIGSLALSEGGTLTVDSLLLGLPLRNVPNQPRSIDEKAE
jgi:hypothetical protein